MDLRLMEMTRWKEHNENHHQFVYNYNGNVPSRGYSQMMMSSSVSSSSSPSTVAYIQHPISKLDTLAGIAIKYGVEVAEIKKMNGLVTESQMFALKILHIPPHGRHPPSTTGQDNPDHSPTDNARGEPLESFQSLRRKSSEQKLSPAISSLQNYYGTKPTMKKSISEIFDLAEKGKGASNSSENGSFYCSNSLKSNRSLSRYHKSEVNLKAIPELILKHDNSTNGGFSARSAKGLAQRQKAGSRLSLTTD
ncbi:lysM and putative peptidoglycan-binding domain-containing protein 1-like [Abrus precatorius]|uniref:LysM and putative peptidoglycan-binding domain-containing protein 1-like n=1 Tax=Abrus precatorius TaxID=3816 RepID=A0A8B8LHE4_ABRPR|nr:lysM and putative peptidoglycan-binding domain-containing protein 1-like [Abrus precatorius]